jgi:uncharacterized protein
LTPKMAGKIEIWLAKKDKITPIHKKTVKKLSRMNEKKLNALADEIHENVFNQIDCLDCANCCKSIPPIINETDVRRISKHLHMKATDFKNQYVKYDEDMDMVINGSPCPFLMQNNTCEIYDLRPKACREYPHTNNFEFADHLKLHAVNSMYCPAVYHIIEELEKKL